LPGLSGGDLAAELAIRHPELPTVFISGYTDDGAARRQITGTRRNFISKPFTGAALITTVADCLKGVHG
jgi:FixJ family two-component response regulator